MHPNRTPLFLAALAAALSASSGANAAETLVFETGADNRISFFVDHPAHDATFVSKSLKFGAEIDGLRDGKPTVTAIDEIRVPFRSFDSGNGSRDSNAMEAMKAFKYPDLVFAPDTAEIKPATATTDRMDARVTLIGDLTLAGVTRHGQTVTGWLHTDYRTWKADGKFSVKCSDYGIERPSLLFVQIADTIPVWFAVGGAVQTPTAATPTSVPAAPAK